MRSSAIASNASSVSRASFTFKVPVVAAVVVVASFYFCCKRTFFISPFQHFAEIKQFLL
jgi:hypothetical protein